jgi:6-pyruvoyl-tetrahydropterin synthase
MSCYQVSVEQSFTASHALPLPGGRREPKHEHTWQVTATYRSAELSGEMDVVVDFVEVSHAMQALAEKLQNQALDSHPLLMGHPASAERVAEAWARELTAGPGGELLLAVEVTEAQGCRAAYFPNVDAASFRT